MPIAIRHARPGDAGTIAEFNILLAKESEDVDLDPAVLGPGVEAALADPAKCRYWIAEEEGRAVGQTMVTYEWSDWRNGWLWWIQSVYVVPAARARGVFRALHGRIAEEARTAGAVGLRLYVFEENRRAKEVYFRLGMKDGRYRVLEQMFGPGHRGESRQPE